MHTRHAVARSNALAILAPFSSPYQLLITLQNMHDARHVDVNIFSHWGTYALRYSRDVLRPLQFLRLLSTTLFLLVVIRDAKIATRPTDISHFFFFIRWTNVRGEARWVYKTATRLKSWRKIWIALCTISHCSPLRNRCAKFALRDPLADRTYLILHNSASLRKRDVDVTVIRERKRTHRQPDLADGHLCTCGQGLGEQCCYLWFRHDIDSTIAQERLRWVARVAPQGTRRPRNMFDIHTTCWHLR